MGTLWRTCTTAPRRRPLPKLLWADLLLYLLLGLCTLKTYLVFCSERPQQSSALQPPNNWLRLLKQMFIIDIIALTNSVIPSFLHSSRRPDKQPEFEVQWNQAVIDAYCLTLVSDAQARSHGGCEHQLHPNSGLDRGLGDTYTWPHCISRYPHIM